MSKLYLRFYVCILLLFSFESYSNDLDKKLLLMSNNVDVVKKGQESFNSYCAGCHKKDLSGAAGFNLKDSEWIHGNKPSQILKNLQNGFEKMPGFGASIQTNEQHAIVAYILSKREGFENLTYKLYQQDSTEDLVIEEKDKIKSGKINHNFMDFELPEIPHYAITFEGDFFAPKEENVYLFAEGVKDFNIEVSIDNAASKNLGSSPWVKRWKLKPGKQHIKLTYISGKSGIKWAAARNISIYVVNEDNTIKIFPVSTRARKSSKNTLFEVKATDQYVVQQKKIVKLPPYSIAVGAPEKINYSFNTRSCSINGLWTGDLLNVGPNIGGRGKDGSIPLGDWLFTFPQQLSPALGNNQVCKMHKYRVDGSPEFYFSINELVMSVIAITNEKNIISFVYRVHENPNKREYIDFDLPNTNKIKIMSANGSIEKEKLTVNIRKQSTFSIDLAWEGDK